LLTKKSAGLGQPETLSTRSLCFGPTLAPVLIVITVSKENKNVLWTIFLILLVLWFLGLVTSYTFGGFVHILLVLAVVVLVIQLIQGRRVV
jgi:hypothetical protein